MITTIPVGTVLFHGSQFISANRYPFNSSGTWFATKSKQSIFHVLQKAKEAPYLSVYVVKKPLKVFKINSVKNFDNFAKSFNFEGLRPFTGNNRHLAMDLCNSGKFDGWWFPKDQAQVMICKPKEFLEWKITRRIVPTKTPKITFVSGLYKKQGKQNWKWTFEIPKTPPPRTVRRAVRPRRSSISSA